MKSMLSLLFVLSTTAWARPASLAAVDAGPAGAIEALARSGATHYGRVGRFLLLSAASPAPAGLDAIPVMLASDEPLYAVTVPNPDFLPRVRQALTVLLEDAGMMLVQLDDDKAHRVRLLGGELFRLPAEPFPVYTPDPQVLPRAAFVDTFIQRLCARVSEDSIRSQMRRLEDFRTRYSPAESCRSSEQYVLDYFTRLGLDSVGLFAFDLEGDTCNNVLGIRWGRVNRDKYVIVCGHLDSESEDHWNYAPGAEDNASGTAMAIEAARVLAHEDFDVTLIFVAFTGEEQGLVGAFYLAQWMRTMNADIVGVLNFDMIAWPGGRFGVAIHGDTASRSLGEYEARMASLYTALETRVDNQQYGSDHLAFHYFGYKATAGAEYGNFYPYYHTTADTLGNCSMPLAADVARMAIATAASLASAPAAPVAFRLQDAGLGGTLHASWQPSPSPDVAGYKVVWGTQSRTYTDSAVLGLVTSHNITGLANGTRYYATVMAIDSGGREGFPAPEQSCMPGVEPLAPAGVTALPFHFGMALAWQPNAELDLAGYNLYRRTAGSAYARLNSALVPHNAYRDSGLLSDTMYYYVLTAVDTSGRESDSSAEVRGKPTTLDHGLLLVDETRDGSGQPGSPSDAQQDAFYHAALRGTRLTDWNCATDGVPLAGDFGPYSTIVWHADDYTQQEIRPALPGLANYLAQGGRLWYVGWKPILGLYGGNSRYPYTFDAGQFAFDQLHLSGAAQSASPDFIGATGQAGYGNVSTDSTKMLSALHGRLSFADVLYPRDAEAVLTFNSFSGDTFQGKPVGVRWLNPPGKAVSFGFPFYYMKDDEARLVALKVLDDLGEPYGIEEGRVTQDALRFTLDAGPSPARRTLLVSYALPRPAPVRLAVYDVSGKLVRQLAVGPRSAGVHSVRLDARPLPAGTYFCRMEAPGFAATRKVELVP